MNVVEKTGKTVEDAVKAALGALGKAREQVNVEVLEEPKSAILGFIGGRDAKVRVTVKEVKKAAEAAAAPVMAEAAKKLADAAAQLQADAEAEEKTEAPETAKKAAPAETDADKEAERQAVAATGKEFLENIFTAMGMHLMIEKFVNRKEDEILLKIHLCKAHRGGHRPPGRRLAGKALRGAQYCPCPRHRGYRRPGGGPQRGHGDGEPGAV